MNMNEVDTFIVILILAIVGVVVAVILSIVVQIVGDMICNHKDTEYPTGNYGITTGRNLKAGRNENIKNSSRS